MIKQTANFYEDLKRSQAESEERYRDMQNRRSRGLYKVFSVEEYIDKFNAKSGWRYVCDNVKIDSSTNKITTIENKYDIRSEETGNVYFEIIERDFTRYVGICKNVDWCVYNFPNDPIFYRFNPKKMLYFLMVNDCQTRQSYRDNQHSTMGFIINREEFKTLPFVAKERE